MRQRLAVQNLFTVAGRQYPKGSYGVLWMIPAVNHGRNSEGRNPTFNCIGAEAAWVCNDVFDRGVSVLGIALCGRFLSKDIRTLWDCRSQSSTQSLFASRKQFHMWSWGPSHLTSLCSAQGQGHKGKQSLMMQEPLRKRPCAQLRFGAKGLGLV